MPKNEEKIVIRLEIADKEEIQRFNKLRRLLGVKTATETVRVVLANEYRNHGLLNPHS